jgi:hypothetical protein
MALDPHTPGRPGNPQLQWVDDRALIEPLYRTYLSKWQNAERLQPGFLQGCCAHIRQRYERCEALARRSLTAGALVLAILVTLALWAPHVARELIGLGGLLGGACFWTFRWTLRERHDLDAQLQHYRAQVHALRTAGVLGDEAAVRDILRLLAGRNTPS